MASPLRLALCSLSLAGAAHAVERDEVPPALLKPAHGDVAEVREAIARLEAHAPAELEAIPGRIFQEPIGISRDADGRLDRWTRHLAQALARHQQPELSLRSLDQRFEVLSQGRSSQELEALAAAFLPAPLAAEVLNRAADRTFDRGQFRRFLGLRRLLIESGVDLLDQGTAARRSPLARDLALGRPHPGWHEALDAPGLPEAVDQLQRAEPEQGLTVSWAQQAGHLLALDPFGRVLWQRALPERSRVWTGARGALLQDSLGTQWIDESGGSRHLPLPKHITILGLAGGAAWFADGLSIHRYDLRDQAHLTTVLPDRPIGPPLVRGSVSWWLTADEIIQVIGGSITGRMLHGLSVEAHWRLVWTTQGDAALENGAGEGWRLPPLHTPAEPADAFPVLVRADRCQEALALWPSITEPEQDSLQHWLAAALMRLGPAGAPDWGWERIDSQVSDRTWRWRLATRWFGTSFGTGAHPALAQTAAQAPEAVAALDPADWPLHRPQTWRHILSGRGWALGSSHDFSAERIRRQTSVGQPTRLHFGPYRLELEQDGLETSLSAFDKAGILCWRQRWQTPAWLPGRAVGDSNGMLVVAEGQSRMRAIDPRNGSLQGAWFVPNGLAMPSQARVLGERLAILHPIGVGNQLTVVDAERTVTVKLHHPAQWQGRMVELVTGESVDPLALITSLR